MRKNTFSVTETDMRKILCDSHTHLNDPAFSAIYEDVIRETEDSAVGLVVNIGFNVENSMLAVRQAAEKDWMYATVAIHPTECYGYLPEAIGRIRELAKNPNVVAIGEIGLDYHYDDTDKVKQEYWFRAQIRLAVELGMPICIHDREAHEDCIRILTEEGVLAKGKEPLVPVLFHCFSGSPELAQRLVSLGVYLSAAGPVTYKNSKKAKEVCLAVPNDRLLIETDAPFLMPEPFRGRFPNTPKMVEYTCRKVAEYKGLSYEETAHLTYQNTKRFYRIP